VRVKRHRPEYDQPRLVVLYEDADVLAVDKPAGINVALENEAEGETSMQSLASDYLELSTGVAPIGPRARLVHRIDKDTSGVVLFAKSPRAQSSLGGDWESGRIEKVYDALVRGTPEASAATIDKPLGRDRDRKALRAVGGMDPQDARTRYRTVESFRDFTLLEVRPLTGRTHQIRVHLKSIDTPLALDPLYGMKDAAPPPEIRRLTLHARTLTFSSPSTRKRITVESPLPRDFVACLDALRGNAPSDSSEE
jgi:23S rRNA pseudouridine1911/1915/1917 synthase